MVQVEGILGEAALLGEVHERDPVVGKQEVSDLSVLLILVIHPLDSASFLGANFRLDAQKPIKEGLKRGVQVLAEV